MGSRRKRFARAFFPPAAGKPSGGERVGATGRGPMASLSSSCGYKQRVKWKAAARPRATAGVGPGRWRWRFRWRRPSIPLRMRAARRPSRAAASSRAAPPGAMSLHISKLRGITDQVRHKLKRQGITYSHQLIAAAHDRPACRRLAALTGIDEAVAGAPRAPGRPRADQRRRRDLRRHAGAVGGRRRAAARPPGSGRAARRPQLG